MTMNTRPGARVSPEATSRVTLYARSAISNCQDEAEVRAGAGQSPRRHKQLAVAGASVHYEQSDLSTVWRDTSLAITRYPTATHGFMPTKSQMLLQGRGELQPLCMPTS